MAKKNYFKHTLSNGDSPEENIVAHGYRDYRFVGENIAAGQGSPDKTVAAWLASPGHCANMMSPAFTEMGIAFVVDRKSQAGIYWTQVLATPR